MPASRSRARLRRRSSAPLMRTHDRRIFAPWDM